VHHLIIWPERKREEHLRTIGMRGIRDTERGFQPTTPSYMFPCPLFLGPLFFPFQARLKIKSTTMCMLSLLRKWTKKTKEEKGKLKNNRNRMHQEKLHLSSTSTAGGGNK
jgi:hypothetical protein